MARYSYTQLENLWVQAGGSQRLSPVMAAIALAESGGNSSATHHNSNGSTDYGLWQINSVHHYNPQMLVSNPEYNAHAAVAVERGSGLGAWSTYNNGSYKKFLNVSSGLPYNPSDSTVGRIDQGVDITSASPFVAVAPGRVTHIDPNFYNGTPAVYIKLDHPVSVNGRSYGAVYYSETRALVHVGQHVQAGQPVTGPGSAEIGFAARFGSSSSSWLPAAHGTYNGHDPTTAGSDFASTIKRGSHGGGGSFWSSNPFGIFGTVATDTASGNPIAGAEALLGGGHGGGVAGALGLGGLNDFFVKLSSASFWLRVAEVAGGGILVLLGLYLLAKQVGLAADVPNIAAVTPGGRLAEGAAAEMQFSAGRANAARRKPRRSADVSEAGTRREAVRSRAARSSNPETNEIPF